MIIANSTICTLLAIYHLISSACSWNKIDITHTYHYSIEKQFSFLCKISLIILHIWVKSPVNNGLRSTNLNLYHSHMLYITCFKKINNNNCTHVVTGQQEMFLPYKCCSDTIIDFRFICVTALQPISYNQYDSFI